MLFKKDTFNKNRPAKIFLANPNRKIIGVLPGIESATLSVKFNDIWELDLEVDKTISKFDELIENPLYDPIDTNMEIYVEDLAWFKLSSAPSVKTDAEREYKTFTVYSQECQLEGIDLIRFVINQGTEFSLERFKENMTMNKEGYEETIEYIRLHYPGKPKLSLIDIIVDNYLTNWSVGYVDPVIAVEKRSFEEESINAYAFLTQNVSKAFRCIFEFDTLNRTINIYSIENYGSETNIIFSEQNLIESMHIEDAHDSLCTRFRVSGGDEDTTIRYYNFGSDMIENLDYLMESGKFDSDLVRRYKNYISMRESSRDTYAELTRQYNLLLYEKTELEDRVPLNLCQTKWNGMDLETLKQFKNTYQGIVDTLEQAHTDENGNLAIEGTVDYAAYLCYTKVILPDIEAEILRKESGSTTPADTVDYKTNWPLYGSTELEVKLKTYENAIAAYTEKGYHLTYEEYIHQDSPDGEAVQSHNEAAHNKQHEKYLEQLNWKNECQAAFDARKKEIAAKDEQLNAVDNLRKPIVEKVQITNPDFGFSVEQLRTIKLSYYDKDYTDKSQIITRMDDTVSAINVAEKLYKAAVDELYIQSRPQYAYSVTMDHLFQIDTYQNFQEQFELGNFVHIMKDGQSVKLRIISFNLDIVNFDNSSFSVTFSNMITSYGKRNDFNELLELSGSSGKNSISRSLQTQIKNTAAAAANSVIKNYLEANYLKAEEADLKYADIEIANILQGSFEVLVGDYLKVGQLDAEVAKLIDVTTTTLVSSYLKANYASLEHLETEAAKINKLQADIAMVNDLLAGNISGSTGHFIRLTAENAVFEEAFFKTLVGLYVTAKDIFADKISTNDFHIESDDGNFRISGNTMQFKDSSGKVRLQIGQDGQGNYSFSILGYDANGQPTGVLMDENGIHEGAITPGLIKNEMISGSAISKDKLNFKIVDTKIDANGNPYIDSVNVKYENDTLSSTIQRVTENVGTFESKITQSANELRKEIKESTIIVNEDETTTTIKDAYNHIKDSVDDHEQNISSLTSQYNTITGDLTSVTNMTADLEANLDGLNLRFSQSKTEFETELKKINTAKISDLQSQNGFVNWNDSFENGLVRITEVHGHTQQSSTPLKNNWAPFNSLGDSGEIKFITCNENISDLVSLEENETKTETDDGIEWTPNNSGNSIRLQMVYDFTHHIGEAYTISFDVKSSGTSGTVTLKMLGFHKSIQTGQTFSAASSWKRHCIKLLPDNSESDQWGEAFILEFAGSAGTSIHIRNIMVSIGYSGDIKNFVAHQASESKILNLKSPLRSVSDRTKDLLYINTHKNTAQIERNVQTLKMGSSEANYWSYQSTNSHGIVNFRYPLPSDFDGTKDVLCTHFKKQDTTLESAATEGFLINSAHTELFLQVLSKDIANITAFRQWLVDLEEANQPLEFLFALKTPAIEDFDEYSWSIEYGSLASHDKFTHITFDSPVLGNFNCSCYPPGALSDYEKYVEIEKVKHASNQTTLNLANGFELIHTNKKDLEAQIETVNTTLSSGLKGIQGTVEESVQKINEIDESFVSKTDFEQTKSDFNFKISLGGGSNLIKDSVGFGDLYSWDYKLPTGTVPEDRKNFIQPVTDEGLKAYGSGGAILLKAANSKQVILSQTIPILSAVNSDEDRENKHTLSCYIKRGTDTCNGTIKVYGVTTDYNNQDSFHLISSDVNEEGERLQEINADSNTYTFKKFTFNASNYTRFKIELTISQGEMFVTSLMLNKGFRPSQWTFASGENYNSTVHFDVQGVKVNGRSNGTYSQMTPDGFSGYYDDEKIFWMESNQLHIKNAVIEDELKIGNIKIFHLQSTDTTTPESERHNGLAFVIAE